MKTGRAGLCALLAWCLLPLAGGQARADHPQPAVSDRASQEANNGDWCAGERPPEVQEWDSTPGAGAWPIQPSFHAEGVQRLARETFQPISQRDAQRLTGSELPRTGYYYLARLGVAAPVDASATELAALIWGWADEDELVDGAIPEVPGASGELIREELRTYHQLWRPHLLADFEFQRPG